MSLLCAHVHAQHFTSSHGQKFTRDAVMPCVCFGSEARPCTWSRVHNFPARAGWTTPQAQVWTCSQFQLWARRVGPVNPPWLSDFQSYALLKTAYFQWRMLMLVMPAAIIETHPQATAALLPTDRRTGENPAEVSAQVNRLRQTLDTSTNHYRGIRLCRWGQNDGSSAVHMVENSQF